MDANSAMNMFSLLLVMIIAVHGGTTENTSCSDASATDICVKYNDGTHTLLKQQVTLEITASYFYQIYGTYFDRSDVALPGFSEYLLRESLHEHTHADNLLHYINQRGGKSSFGDIKISDLCNKVIHKCFCRHVAFNENLDNCLDTNNTTDNTTVHGKNDTDETVVEKTIKKVGLWALQDSLAIEKLVMKELMNIVDKSMADHQLTHYIEHQFLDEQIQTIKRLGSFIGQLNKFSGQEYFIAEYNFDKQLFKKVRKTTRNNEESKQKATMSSHYQWPVDGPEYDSLYI